MAVIRTPLPHSSFTMLRNCWLRDARTSYKAKGLLGYLMSHADGYRVSQAQIVRESSDGRDAVVSGLRELEAAGYLTRQPRRTETGRFGEDDYALADPFDQAGKLIAPTPRETRTVTPLNGRETRHSGKPDAADPMRQTLPIEEHLEQTNPAPNGAGATDPTPPPPPAEPTLAEQARLIAGEHHDAVGGLAPFMGVVKIVTRALGVLGDDGAPRYTPDRVRDALRVLREAGRPVTLQTVHAALETPQAVGARRPTGPYRDPAPAAYDGRF